MGTIQRLITAEESSIDQDRFSMGERNDCAVKMMALTTGLPYRTVHEALRLAGRRARCGTYLHQSDKAFKDLGFEMRPVRFNPCTTRTVINQLPRTGRFYVRVSRHALAVVNGKVMDWSEGRLKRVKEIYEIIRAGTPTPAAVIVKPVIMKPYMPKVEINFQELRMVLRDAYTVQELMTRFGASSNQIRSSIDALRRRGADIRNVARNTFQLFG